MSDFRSKQLDAITHAQQYRRQHGDPIDNLAKLLGGMSYEELVEAGNLADIFATLERLETRVRELEADVAALKRERGEL